MRAPQATIGVPFGAAHPAPEATTGSQPRTTTPPLAPRAPLELTGQRRDDAKLLVGWRSDGQLVEARMADIGDFLEPGDVLLVNNSTTRPAAIAVDDELVVHLSTELAEDLWVVEPRHLAGEGSTPWLDYDLAAHARRRAAVGGPEGTGGRAERRVTRNGPHRRAADTSIPLPRGGKLTLLAPYRVEGHPVDRHVRLWTASLDLPTDLDEYLARYGRPIRYGADAGAWPLDAYQTVFATTPGSAEMPSAARGFTTELVTRLVSQGVTVAPITLHTGVASQEAGETPYPERYDVPDATAAAVNRAKATGHRVIAVGTTATRAIESVADPDGQVRRGRGWTNLVITPERGVYVVDGLLTGWHDPEASHLFLVEAVAGRDLLERSYAAAVDHDFRGHEFGDFHLILP